MVYGVSKDLTKRTQSDKNLRDKAAKTASNPKCDGYQRGLASIVLTMNQIIGLQMNFIGTLLENSRDEKFIHCFKTIFGVLI